MKMNSENFLPAFFVSFDRWRFKVFYGVSIVLISFLGQTISRSDGALAVLGIR